MKNTNSLYHKMLLSTIALVFAGAAYIMYDLTQWQNRLEARADAKISRTTHVHPMSSAMPNAPAPIELEDNDDSWRGSNRLEPEYRGPKHFTAKGLPQSYEVENLQVTSETTYGTARSMQSTVYAGTQIELETTTPIDVKYITAGQTIDLRVKYDVVIGRNIAIPAGSVAKAMVNDARRKKLFRKSQLCIEPKYVQTPDGRFVPLSGRPVYFQSKNNFPLSAGATLFSNIAATTEVETGMGL